MVRPLAQEFSRSGILNKTFENLQIAHVFNDSARALKVLSRWDLRLWQLLIGLD